MTLPHSVSVVRYPYAELGHADHGWLEARHHFSFARYWNPQRIGFGALLVINDDIIAPHHGFPMHPHEHMEIITYVRAGAITHEDSLGNVGRTEAGDLQVMSAGSGVRHSEYNWEAEPTRLYQIWIQPNASVAPRWEAKAFPKGLLDTALPVLVSGREADLAQGALRIYADAAVYGGRVKAGISLWQPMTHRAYLLVSEGSICVEGVELTQGDGAEVTGADGFLIHAQTDAELLVIDLFS